MSFRLIPALAAALLLSLSAVAPTPVSADLIMLSNGGRTGVAQAR